MKSAYDIEKLTAYLLEELDDSEKKEVESILEKDESARAALEELKQAVELSYEAFGQAAASDLSLKDEQRAKVRKSAKDSAHLSAGEEMKDALFAQPKGGLFEGGEVDEPAPSFDFDNTLFAKPDENGAPDSEELNPFAGVSVDDGPTSAPADGPVFLPLDEPFFEDTSALEDSSVFSPSSAVSVLGSFSSSFSSFASASCSLSLSTSAAPAPSF